MEFNKYEEADFEGRIKVMKALYMLDTKNTIYSNSLHSVCDLTLNNNINIECKDIKSDSHKYNRVIIDKYKIDALENLNKRYYLAYSYNDGIVRLYDFKKMFNDGKIQLNNKVVTWKSTVEKTDFVEKPRYFWDFDEYDYEINTNNGKILTQKTE